LAENAPSRSSCTWLQQPCRGAYPHAHGAPIHGGDPEAIGITDLGRPDYGEPVPVDAKEVPHSIGLSGN
jgi:uncharacterized protein YcsI (UPF0317 family)